MRIPYWVEFILNWLIIGALVALLFWLADAPLFSAGWMRQFFARFSSGMSGQETGSLVFWVRKTIHFVGYGLLALLVYFRGLPRGTGHWPRVGFALVFALAVAIFDEWYQTTIPHRTGQLGDVLIDLAGILTSLTVVSWVRLREREEQPVREN